MVVNLIAQIQPTVDRRDGAHATSRLVQSGRGRAARLFSRLKAQEAGHQRQAVLNPVVHLADQILLLLQPQVALGQAVLQRSVQPSNLMDCGVVGQSVPQPSGGFHGGGAPAVRAARDGVRPALERGAGRQNGVGASLLRRCGIAGPTHRFQHL